jgi:hypothetical protein
MADEWELLAAKVHRKLCWRVRGSLHTFVPIEVIVQ